MVVVPLRGSSSGTVLLEVDIILMGLLVSSERKLL